MAPIAALHTLVDEISAPNSELRSELREGEIAPVLAARFEDVEDAVIVLEMAAARRRTARREG